MMASKNEERNALSRIAREAGIGGCAESMVAKHLALERILKICEDEGYDILGEPIVSKKEEPS